MGEALWEWSVRRLCNYMHVQLVRECESEKEAEDLIAQLTQPPEQVEEQSRADLTQQMELAFPGAIVRG